MKSLRKLLPGGKREPKVLAVFANRQQECDRIIRHLTRGIANSPYAQYPIYVYCLEQPHEAQRCSHVVVDPDPDRLYERARLELADAWVALSGTSWNNLHPGTRLKLIPLTLPPFRGVVCNENGDFFPLRPIPVLRHMMDRFRQWRHETFAELAQWIDLRIIWPARHGAAWFRGKVQDKIVWGTAVALGKMSWFAERIVPVTRAMYNRLPPGEPEPIDLPAAPYPPAQQATSGITRIEYQGMDWKRDEIVNLLQQSNCRFVLFCPSDYVENFDDFLPLFDDPLTFAVTRQHGYREWRKFLVALSPFRILAPKEASRVAAPLAKVVLVDRLKLLKLDIPDTLVYGAAWLSLYWRAGAAGWRSYCIGGNDPIEEQLDYWLEEMLFVKNLYLNPELKRLANDAPALCRGNIAFRADLAKPYRPLPRVLIAAPYLPFPLSHGGAVRVYNLCRALADKVDFIYISFRENNQKVEYEELHRIFRRVYVVDRDENNRNPDLPGNVNYFETSSMRAVIADVARLEKVDLLQLEWTDMAAYRETVPQRPAILVEHDITYTLHRQFTEQDKSEAVKQEYERWLKFETERLRIFDSVFVMSPQDLDEAVKSGSNPQRTYVIPNGVDLKRFAAMPPSTETDPEIFYVGSFRHLPNYLGFEELRLRIMPRVWEKYPRAKLRVVAGPDHEEHWRRALKNAALPQLDPRIIVHGFVSDLVPLYESAHIVAVPLPVSAGTNIKVMEAMGCSRAVVTTPVGAQGLGLKNGFDAVICALGDEFAAALCRLIENPEARDLIAKNGRTTAEARFSWDAIARDALDAYSLLIRESRAKRAAGNGRKREEDKKQDQGKDDGRSKSRGVLESA